jgi:hypothetical protein
VDDPITNAARAFPTTPSMTDDTTAALRQAYLRGWRDCLSGGVGRPLPEARPEPPPTVTSASHVMVARRNANGRAVIMCSCGRTVREQDWDAHVHI